MVWQRDEPGAMDRDAIRSTRVRRRGRSVGVTMRSRSRRCAGAAAEDRVQSGGAAAQGTTLASAQGVERACVGADATGASRRSCARRRADARATRRRDIRERIVHEGGDVHAAPAPVRRIGRVRQIARQIDSHP